MGFEVDDCFWGGIFDIIWEGLFWIVKLCLSLKLYRKICYFFNVIKGFLKVVCFVWIKLIEGYGYEIFCCIYVLFVFGFGCV